MKIHILSIPYSQKKKMCLKRIQKRQLKSYKNCVQQIVETGKVEINGSVINSIADLTIAFYSSQDCVFHYNIQKK